MQIQKGIAGLRKSAKIDMSVLRATKASVWAEVEKLVGLHTVPARRKCAVYYRGWKIELSVKCVMEQIDIALHAACRGWAVAQERMNALPGEKDLCLLAEKMPRAEVGMDVIGKACEARDYIGRVIDAEGEKVSAERIKETMR
eukprot:4803364-Amphidinium_carterae.1